MYVVDIDPATNRITLGEREQLLRTSLVARQVNMLGAREGMFCCQAKIRYNHQPQPAVSSITGPDELTVRFDEPQAAITPGQAVVLYEGDVVLGGGWIESASS
jgi:tRNA-specific 2-thiouridylase